MHACQHIPVGIKWLELAHTVFDSKHLERFCIGRRSEAEVGYPGRLSGVSGKEF